MGDVDPLKSDLVKLKQLRDKLLVGRYETAKDVVNLRGDIQQVRKDVDQFQSDVEDLQVIHLKRVVKTKFVNFTVIRLIDRLIIFVDFIDLF